MNFFQAQDKARQSTARLVIFFGLAVVTLIVMTNLLVMVVISYFFNDPIARESFSQVGRGQGSAGSASGAVAPGSTVYDAFIQNFDWHQFMIVGLAVLVVVVVGSTYKILSLSSGGKVVAEMLGGRRVLPNTDDPDEKRLLNVVEEMAIASGSPVPVVYLLAEESGINAFAAGSDPGNAVIGVTRGCVKHLNRDQLQGVIAHEFSHILNGDMRLNIRIMGILHGILVIGMIGYYLLRSARYSRRREGGGPQLVLGLGLMVIGFSGSFFGSLIKASVSRQREFLADASAVQFTRNPDGIANALKKIGGLHAQGTIENPTAPQISHAFFVKGVSSFFTDLFSTHPPLEQRIRKLQPSWDGKYIVASENAEPALHSTTNSNQAQPQAQPQQANGLNNSITQTIITSAALAAIDNIGKPTAQHLGYAQQLRQELPTAISQALREPFSARAVVFGLLISQNKSIQDIQLAHLNKHSDDGVYDALLALIPEIQSLDSKFRLPIVDTAVATLRDLSAQQYQLFKKNFQALIEADKKISLFEWALHKNLFQYLDTEFMKHSILPSTGKFASVKPLINEAVVVLSLLAHAEHKNSTEAENVFNKGVALLNEGEQTMLPKSALSLKALNQAIDRLSLLKPLVKPQFLKACATCIAADHHISQTEVELLRAFSAALDCPMPPLLQQ